jgi:Secretion system C-terminal sorting domain
VLVSVFPNFIFGQTIFTIAGNGNPTHFGDNGYAISSSVAYIGSGTFDKYGNYYFVEATNGHTVRKIDLFGIITTVTGIPNISGFSGDNGLATLAKLNNPTAVSIDTNGNLFISDQTNARIRKVDISTGIITTICGTGTLGYNGDNILATSAQINDVLDICFDKFGNLFLADYYNNRIRKINTLGIISTYAGNGIGGYSGEGGLADTSMINGPTGVCTDDTGNLYIACSDARIMKVHFLSGIISTYAGNGIWGNFGDSGLAINANIYPYSITFDKFSNLFIGEAHGGTLGDRIRKVDSAGIITTVCGTGIAGYFGDSGLASTAQINNPTGVTTDQCGNLYIADDWNHRIRKVWFNTDTLPQVNATITPNDTVVTGTQVTTTATATNHGTITSYQWVKNGANASTNSAYTYTPVNGDSVYCIVTVRACTGRMYTDTTTSIHITVTGGARVNSITNSIMHTYPNPVTHVLHVTTTEPQHYVLHNLMGVAVLQGSVDKQNSIDMKAIPSGIYLLQLTNTQGQREVVRVVKE